VGARLRSTDVDPLPISQPVGFRVKDDEHALQIKDELAAWLITEEPAPLQFDDEPGRTYYALLQGTIEDFDKFVNQRKGTLNFLCLDPYGYGETRNLNIGTSFNTHSVGGQVKTPWSSRTVFSVAASSFTMENNQGGRILLNHNFIAGDVLEIDYKRRKITRNGEDLAVALSMSSHWFELKPGSMQLRASHATTVTYSERYY
jgi:predicted phage tail component-like protein